MTPVSEQPSSIDLPPIAVCLSGTGRTLQNLLCEKDAGRLRARICVVVSSVAGARGLEIANSAGIPTFVVNRNHFSSDDAFSAEVFAGLEKFQPVLIVLAGFLRRLVVFPAWKNRILNIHPALLPEMAFASGRGFYGDRVHVAVLASGARVSGATVHIVDNKYDTGPVLMRRTVPVMPEDTVRTLAGRVFEIEKQLYPAAINAYLRSVGSAAPEKR